MNLELYQKKIIEQLIAQEKLLSELHTILSNQFNEYQEFWQKLSQEEHKHARKIQILTAGIYFIRS